MTTWVEMLDKTALRMGILKLPEWGLLCPRCGSLIETAEDLEPGGLPECRTCFERDHFECPTD